MVKPAYWKVLQSIDATYQVLFTYVDPSRGDFAEVITARGDVKIYKTTKAVLHDIQKIQPTAIIQFHWNQS